MHKAPYPPSSARRLRRAFSRTAQVALACLLVFWVTAASGAAHAQPQGTAGQGVATGQSADCTLMADLEASPGEGGYSQAVTEEIDSFTDCVLGGSPSMVDADQQPDAQEAGRFSEQDADDVDVISGGGELGAGDVFHITGDHVPGEGSSIDLEDAGGATGSLTDGENASLIPGINGMGVILDDAPIGDADLTSDELMPVSSEGIQDVADTPQSVQDSLSGDDGASTLDADEIKSEVSDADENGGEGTDTTDTDGPGTFDGEPENDTMISDFLGIDPDLDETSSGDASQTDDPSGSDPSGSDPSTTDPSGGDEDGPTADDGSREDSGSGSTVQGRGAYCGEDFGGVQPHVAEVGCIVFDEFGVMDYSGYRPGDPQDHGQGLALDFMVYDDSAKGDAIVDFGMGRWGEFNLTYMIWFQQINFGTGWEPMEDRGDDTQNHYDHPHWSFEAQGGG